MQVAKDLMVDICTKSNCFTFLAKFIFEKIKQNEWNAIFLSKNVYWAKMNVAPCHILYYSIHSFNICVLLLASYSVAEG